MPVYPAILSRPCTCRGVVHWETFRNAKGTVQAKQGRARREARCESSSSAGARGNGLPAVWLRPDSAQKGAVTAGSRMRSRVRQSLLRRCGKRIQKARLSFHSCGERCPKALRAKSNATRPRVSRKACSNISRLPPFSDQIVSNTGESFSSLRTKSFADDLPSIGVCTLRGNSESLANPTTVSCIHSTDTS